MALAEDLKLLADQVRKRQVNVKGEEAAKQALILPFLSLLGFDIYDPTIVQPEFVADFARKSKGPLEKVDYALHAGGQPVIFMECKAADASLSNHDAQLARYFNATPSVRLAIITNGISYRFFTDLLTANIMDERPFFEFNVFDYKERDVETLSHYTAAEFRPDHVQKHAQELVFIDKVGGLLAELIRNPSEAFVRFLLNQMDIVQGSVTAKVVDRFVPIVRMAFAGAVMEITTRGLSQTLATPVAAPAVPLAAPTSPAAVPATDAAGDGKVVTTAEELDLFERVNKIVAKSTAKVPIVYKDTATYFGVNLGKVTRWFLRFFGSGTTKYIVLRAPLAVLKPLMGDVEATAFNAAETRVNVTSGVDVDKLSAAVVAAYEAEVKRKDADAGADTPAAS